MTDQQQKDEQISAQGGPAIPDIICQVREDNTVVHGGEHHGPGDEFQVEGPTAISLVQAGHVNIVGSAHPADKPKTSRGGKS